MIVIAFQAGSGACSSNTYPKNLKYVVADARVLPTEQSLMVFGMYFGQGVNGNQFKKNGSVHPVAFFINVFKPGSKKGSLRAYSRQSSNTMLENKASVGNGNL